MNGKLCHYFLNQRLCIHSPDCVMIGKKVKFVVMFCNRLSQKHSPKFREMDFNKIAMISRASSLEIIWRSGCSEKSQRKKLFPIYELYDDARKIFEFVGLKASRSRDRESARGFHICVLAFLVKLDPRPRSWPRLRGCLFT